MHNATAKLVIMVKDDDVLQVGESNTKIIRESQTGQFNTKVNDLNKDMNINKKWR